MHLGCFAIRSEYEFRIDSDGEATPLRRFIFDPQALNAHRIGFLRLHGNKGQKQLFDAVAVVFDLGIALAVTGTIGIEFAHGQGRGRPKHSAFFIANIDGFGGGIGDRIIAPGCQAVGLAVAVPAGTGTRLADDGTEDGIGHHVDPGQGSERIGAEIDGILAPVGGKATKAVKVRELKEWKRERGLILAPLDLQLRGHGDAFGRTAELLGKGTASRAHGRLSDRENQIQILFGKLIRLEQEYAAGLRDASVESVRFYKAKQLVLQRLLIACGFAIENDKIGFEAMQAPVSMSDQQLADESEILRIVYPNQRDGQVSRDAMGPESGLGLDIAAQAFCGCAQSDVRIEQVAGEFGKTQCRIALNAEVAELELGVGPGEFEGAAAHVDVAVFEDEAHQIFARCSGNRNERDLYLLPWFERNPPAHYEDGIEDEASGLVERQERIAPGATAAETLRAIGFVLERRFAFGTLNHQLRNPNGGVVRGSRSAPGNEGVQFRPRFGLNKHLAEGWVGTIGAMGREAQFGGAGQGNVSQLRALIHEGDAANLHIVFRRYRYLHQTFDPHLAAAEFSVVGAKSCGVAGVFHAEWLMRHGPKRVAGVFGKINESSPVVTSGVGTPAGDVEVSPAAIAGTGVGDHERVAAIAQQLDARDGSVFVEDPVFRH